MRIALPAQEWPEPDKIMWRALVHTASPFDKMGALAHLRLTSQGILERAYAQWLQWLKQNDPGALLDRPEARATPGRLTTWLEDLSRYAPMTRLTLFESTLRILRATAPEQDWEAQRRVVARLRAEAGRGSQERKIGRVLSSRTLLEAGLRHSGPEADAAPSAFQAARRRRDGAMIALLALMPIRRRAFCSLVLGESLCRIGEHFVVALSPEMTKTGGVWESVVPDVVTPALRRYLDEVRPYFMARGEERHDVLWVGQRGAPIPDSSMGSRIGTITEKLLGVRIPPHFFRDSAATALARIAPERVGLIKPLLDHSTHRTAERHYIHARGIEAGRDYAAVIARIKRGVR